MQSAYGCLLIHGLGGGVYEVEPLIKPLEEKGFVVAAPKLKGHTTEVKDLKDVDYKQWIFSAETSLLKLVQQCKKIYVVGLGMGGLIAIELCSRHSIAALVCVNTPVYNRYLVGNVLAKKSNMPWKRKLPWSAVKNFRLLLAKTKPLIQRIKIPVKVAQSENEVLATEKSASYLYSHFHAVVKQRSIYTKGGYSLFTGDEGGNAVKDILDFFSNLEKIIIA